MYAYTEGVMVSLHGLGLGIWVVRVKIKVEVRVIKVRVSVQPHPRRAAPQRMPAAERGRGSGRSPAQE